MKIEGISQAVKINTVSADDKITKENKENRQDKAMNAEQKAERQISEKDVITAIEKANKALKAHYTTFEFSIHEKTKEIMVKVIDKETGELIREIPPEKILDAVAKMWELAGLLVDEKA
ncbi:flagellar protein FlaG [Zhaonella formicivorans]|uniref:flagellar protein FlaG n=1 Tax=Zhaonella formicivorans TaxID=2528593 RepID=UPI0010DBBE13|nr:flagellar protein FlaG [Zhaonella formicivorans]